MKINAYFRFFVLAGLIAVAAGCSEDTTLEAQVDLSDTTIEVTKRGVDYRGATVTFDVTSNVYWMITNAEQYDWLDVSPRGGSGSTTVYVRIDGNAGAARTATLHLEIQDGTTYSVEIKQAGAGEAMTYLTEDFGETTEEKLPIGAFQKWGYDGAGTTGSTYRYAYAGTNAYVQSEHPSSGYEGASGGNGILLEGTGSEFSIRNFNAQNEQHFRMQFAAVNTEGHFSEDEFKLQISRDNQTWFDMAYERSETDEWALARLAFTIPESMDCLYFRFLNLTEDDYAIDDLRIDEGVASDENQVFDFIYVAPGFRGLPVGWDLSTLTASDERGTQWTQERTIACDGDEAATLSYFKVPESVDSHNVYDVSGGNPRVTGSFLGDYWLFTVPVENMEANTSVNLAGTLRSSAKGNKYYAIEYSADGEQWQSAPGSQTKDVTIKGVTEQTTFHVELIDASTDSKVDKTVTFTEPVENGKVYFRLRVSGNATNDLSRFNTAANAGTTRLTGQWTLAKEERMEGLPVYWSFPEDGLATGMASKAERFYYCDDFAQTTRAARIDAVREAVPSGTTSPDMSYTIGADGEIGRVLMYGFALDDYWKFTVPVKHLKAGTRVNLRTILSSSGSGPKFFLAEYSTDEGATWKTGSETHTVEDKSAKDDVTRTIVYHYATPDSPANADCVVDETITVGEGIAEGNLCLRLRVCDPMACNKGKNIVAANGGTTRMKTKTGAVEQISITVVE